MKSEVAPSLTEPPESEYLVWDAPNIDFKELVAAMLGGLHISLVDPAILPQIVPHIQRYIEYYQESHKQRYVKELNDFLRYIENGPRGGQIKSLLKAPSTPPRRQTAASTPEIKAITDRILEQDDLDSYPTDQVPLIVDSLRHRCAQFIEGKDYVSAARADQFSRILVSHEQLDIVGDMQETRATALQEKLDEAQANLDASKRKWEELHGWMKKARDTELSQMSDQHAQQISTLEQLFNEKPPPEVRKYSAALLQLRRREQAMLQTRHYAVASGIKDQADELQRVEDERQLQQWHARINDRIRKCRARQQGQATGRKAYWKTEEQKMIREAESEIAIAGKQIEHLRANVEIKLSAKRAATTLKNIDRDFQNLPTLNGKDPKQEFRQRQILAAKMYTRTQSRHRPDTARKRTA